MTRVSKKAERRGRSPRRCKAPQPKTGPLKDNLPKGFKEHSNAVDKELAASVYIPKIQ